MNNQMVLIGAGELCTVAYAAAHIGVGERSIRLMVGRGTLARVPLIGANDEDKGPLILYTQQVQEYAAARKLIRT